MEKSISSPPELLEKVESSLAEARQFAQTREQAASPFVRMSAMEGLKTASDDCLSGLKQIQALLLDSPDTLLQASKLSDYNQLELYIQSVDKELTELRRPVLARIRFIRRRVYPVAGVAALLSVVLFLGFSYTPAPKSLNNNTGTEQVEPTKTDQSPAQNTYVSATKGEVKVAPAGSRFDAFKGSTLTAENLSVGKANEGAIVIAKAGSQVTAFSGSAVYAHKGAQVIAKRGANVTAQPGAVVQAEDGVNLTWKDELPGFAY